MIHVDAVRRALPVAAVAAIALAAAPGGAQATTFSGSCTASGTSHFTPPYGAVPKHSNFPSDGTGSCHGVLDGQPYDGPAVVHVDGRMQHPMSCFVGFASGTPALLTFGTDPKAVDATQMDLILHQIVHFGTEMTIHFGGAYGGVAIAQVSFDERRPESLEKCTTGDGLATSEFTLRTDTITTMYG